MPKPHSKQESNYQTDYRWVKGRVSRRFRKKYGQRVPNAELAKFLKRQARRARRRAEKRFDVQE